MICKWRCNQFLNYYSINLLKHEHNKTVSDFPAGTEVQAEPTHLFVENLSPTRKLQVLSIS